MGENGSNPEVLWLLELHVDARAVLCLHVRRCLTLPFLTLR